MRHLEHADGSAIPLLKMNPAQRSLTDDWPDDSGDSVGGTTQPSVETPCPQRRDPRDQYECPPKDTSQPSALYCPSDDEHCRRGCSTADRAADEVDHHRREVDPFVIQERVHPAERQEQSHRGDLLACAVPCDIVVGSEVARDSLRSSNVAR